MAPEDRLKAKQQTNELGHASPRVRPTECGLQAPPDQPHAAGLSNAHTCLYSTSLGARKPTHPTKGAPNGNDLTRATRRALVF